MVPIQAGVFTKLPLAAPKGLSPEKNGSLIKKFFSKLLRDFLSFLCGTQSDTLLPRGHRLVPEDKVPFRWWDICRVSFWVHMVAWGRGTNNNFGYILLFIRSQN